MAKRPMKKPGKASVEAIKHKDPRKNIPTQELRGFVRDDETKPKTITYPRDPTLDPQLVWKGKDEQDSKPLAIPAVPIYIQEKIHPQAIVEDLRLLSKGDREDPQASLFADFNGLDDFQKKVDFYHHDQHWSNRMILGDSLLVMTSLAEKEGLKGKVQTIYMDPPYGIKFGSNWQVSTRKRDVKDGKVEDATRQPEQVKAFRDTWELGIHSYLAYLRDRLVVARDLLAETGSIFVQIGDENLHLVRAVMDEVFGSNNFASLITFKKTTSAGGGPTGTTSVLASVCDYVLWYARDMGAVKYRHAYLPKELGGLGAGQYTWIETKRGERRRAAEGELTEGDSRRVLRLDNLTSQTAPPTTIFEVEVAGKRYSPGKGGWKTNVAGMKKLAWARRLHGVGNTLAYVRYFEDFPVFPLSNSWDDTVTSGFGDAKTYVVQTNPLVIQRCVMMTSDPGDLVLDPTCGSGTTAYVAEQWGRRWITIDTSRVALALARTRLMAAKYPYYLLSDSEEGDRKDAEVAGRAAGDGPWEGDVRRGFVYERVPHVTLKSIANNPEIKEGMTREQIDAAIARHAESETLYDRPYEDGKRVRVAGPFTVESLSPHRVLPTDEERPASEAEGRRESASGQFETTILDNLHKAGVKGTKKGEGIAFDRLESFAGGIWLQAEGEFTDADGKSRRVAVAIGPEHGTVGTMLLKEAAKEAVKGRGFDVLVVCGFAFDPYVSEETVQFGKLRVVIARMNPDLAMGGDLLKKTGSGNLFMVFGEPDVVVKKAKDGQVVVELRGVDVYDPTTGEIRSNSTDDVACWFIDSDYDGESFFVRHAYFLGSAKGDEGPYDRLKRALRAEIDEAAWAALYSTVSRPFPRPASGKVAVKVINHFGDEVLKVISV